MLSVERTSHPHSPLGRQLLVVDDWAAHELALDIRGLDFLWDKVRQFPTLFTDASDKSRDQMLRSITNPSAYWIELWRDGRLEGVASINEIVPGIDARIHPIFFDRHVQSKVAVSKALLKWVFNEFNLRRLTAAVPAIYFSTIRLAQICGFQNEGMRRGVYPIGGRWVDERILGLLASEI